MILLWHQADNGVRWQSETNLDEGEELTKRYQKKSPENKAITGFYVPETAFFGLPKPMGWKRMQ